MSFNESFGIDPINAITEANQWRLTNKEQQKANEISESFIEETRQELKLLQQEDINSLNHTQMVQFMKLYCDRERSNTNTATTEVLKEYQTANLALIKNNLYVNATLTRDSPITWKTEQLFSGPNKALIDNIKSHYEAGSDTAYEQALQTATPQDAAVLTIKYGCKSFMRKLWYTDININTADPSTIENDVITTINVINTMDNEKNGTMSLNGIPKEDLDGLAYSRSWYRISNMLEDFAKKWIDEEARKEAEEKEKKEAEDKEKKEAEDKAKKEAEDKKKESDKKTISENKENKEKVESDHAYYITVGGKLQKLYVSDWEFDDIAKLVINADPNKIWVIPSNKDLKDALIARWSKGDPSRSLEFDELVINPDGTTKEMVTKYKKDSGNREKNPELYTQFISNPNERAAIQALLQIKDNKDTSYEIHDGKVVYLDVKHLPNDTSILSWLSNLTGLRVQYSRARVRDWWKDNFVNLDSTFPNLVAINGAKIMPNPTNWNRQAEYDTKNKQDATIMLNDLIITGGTPQPGRLDGISTID